MDIPEEPTSRGWRIEPSDAAKRSNNPIRRIVEGLKKPDLPSKPHIALSLGDPTIYGNLKTADVLVKAVEKSLKSYEHNGYIHSAGDVAARTAVAAWMSAPGRPALTADDVVIASGCSGALDLAISVLLNPGDNLLIPRPGFPLYATLCEAKGVSTKSYALLPERQWEVDLDDMEALIDDRTRAILVNNPSNPCGSVYSQAHLTAILKVAAKHRLPIIADEIYGNLVFPSTGAVFHPLASLSDDVPVIAAGGIAKEFLVPGWRVGWLAVHDRHGALAEVRKGLYALTQLILGASSLVLAALPAILTPAVGSEDAESLSKFHAATVAQLEDLATFAADELAKVSGLSVVRPQGAMYLMVRIDPLHFTDIASDVEFAQKLVAEENVLVLPGSAFSVPNFVRIVYTAPREVLAEAFVRVAAFCDRHRRAATATW